MAFSFEGYALTKAEKALCAPSSNGPATASFLFCIRRHLGSPLNFFLIDALKLALSWTTHSSNLF
jgi:hypothetical protein